jgi:hypothetical protein
LQSGAWQIHHDTALAHCHQPVQQFLAKHNISRVNEPPLLPGHGAVRLFHFPQIKNNFKGKLFEDVETIIPTAAQNFLQIHKA